MNEIVPVETSMAVFANSTNFEVAQRMATAISKSTLVPKEFQGNLPNCLIALELANRIGASPLSVFQNLYIVHGKPSWSSQFIIAAVNASGRYSPIRFDISGEGDKKTCIAWAIEKGSNERLESPPVSIDMAKKEGWMSKAGSKWQTMPDLMLRYRAATFFGRLYAPEILMGMATVEELVEREGDQPEPKKKGKELVAQFVPVPELPELINVPSDQQMQAVETVDETTGEVTTTVEPVADIDTKQAPEPAKCAICGFPRGRHAPTCDHYGEEVRGE